MTPWPGPWLSRLFPYKVMNGTRIQAQLRKGRLVPGRIIAGGCDSLHRWTALSWPFRLYLHCWVGQDWSLDLHDHSGWMVSIGLTGWYDERTEAGVRRYRAPWVRWFPATHRHRIEAVRMPTWTLCVMPRIQRKSSFYLHGRAVASDAYHAQWAASRRVQC